MSSFTVEVVKIAKEPHLNADSLSIVKVHGYQVVVRTDDWSDGDLAAYIAPDSVVPELPEYAFLEGKYRIKARRFRGAWSFGLLMPAPDGAQEGDNVADVMNIKHYEPPLKGKGMGESAGDIDKSPPFAGPVYDVENIQRYNEEFKPGEEVVVTEKIHGANIRLTYQDGKFYVASRRFYRKEMTRLTGKDLFEKIKFFVLAWLGKPQVWMTNSDYWTTFKSNPELQQIVRDNPDLIFYGELYGSTQGEKFKYDVEHGNQIRIFDALDPRTGDYLPWSDLAKIVPDHLLVPVDFIGPFDMNTIASLAETPSRLASKHVREGVVVKTIVDTRSPAIGRRILKYVNPNYLVNS